MSLGSASARRRRRVPPRSHTWRKLVLTVGFLAFAVGTFVAWISPADGYELSIYTGTPIGFWLGVAIAFLAAAVVTAVSARDRIAGLAVVLGVFATVAIGGLPVLRSYRFYGLYDALSHLGWVEGLASGELGFLELFYPAGHTSSVFLMEVTGLSAERATMLYVAILVGVYAVFVPLVARALLESSRAAVVAAFSAFMLLPFTNVSTALQFHTYSLGTLFLPVFLYLFVKHVTSPVDRGLLGAFGGWNAALALAGAAMLFLHPQVTLNVIILLGTLAGLHVLCHVRDVGSRIAELRPVYGQFFVLSAAWAVWVIQHPQVFVVSGNVVTSVRETLLGTAEAGQTVQDAGASATAIGASLPELFVKLFLVKAVYAMLALWIVLYALRGPVGGVPERSRSVVSYFGYAGLVLGPFFLAHFAGDISHLFFRHFGFSMAIATVLGAVGIHYLAGLVPGGAWRSAARPIAVGLLSVALLLSLISVQPSPYIYNQSHHVSDYQMNGYEVAFAHHDEDVEVTAIRAGPNRYRDALTDAQTLGGGPRIPEEVLRSNPSTAYADDRYLPVTSQDRQREVIAYRELRYSEAALASLDEHPGVHRVQSNGEFDLYYIEGNGPGVEEEEE